MIDTKIPSRRGRPRTFDKSQAVDAATQLFWKQGFEGTSVADLTQAMGINPPSLYACFGSKEGVFRAVLDQYGETVAARFEAAQAAPTLREAAAELLLGAAKGICGQQKGCLLVQAGLAASPDAASIQEEMASRRRLGEEAIRARIRRAEAAGELLPGTDVEALTLMLVALLRGMAVLASDGASPTALEAMARLAVASLPLRP